MSRLLAIPGGRRLCIEIAILLVVKIMALYVIRDRHFSDPIPEAVREAHMVDAVYGPELNLIKERQDHD